MQTLMGAVLLISFIASAGEGLEDFLPADERELQQILDTQFSHFEEKRALLINPQYRQILRELVVADKLEEFDQKLASLSIQLALDQKEFLTKGRSAPAGVLFDRLIECLRYKIVNDEDADEFWERDAVLFLTAYRREKGLQLLGRLMLQFPHLISAALVQETGNFLLKYIRQTQKLNLSPGQKLGLIRRALETYVEVFFAVGLMENKGQSVDIRWALARGLKNLEADLAQIHLGEGESAFRVFFKGVRLITSGADYVRLYGGRLYGSYSGQADVVEESGRRVTRNLTARQRNLEHAAGISYALLLLSRIEITTGVAPLSQAIRDLPLMSLIFSRDINAFTFFRPLADEYKTIAREHLRRGQDLLDARKSATDPRRIGSDLPGPYYGRRSGGEEDRRVQKLMDQFETRMQQNEGTILIETLRQAREAQNAGRSLVEAPQVDPNRSMVRRITDLFKRR